jgi:hypothetical protein
VVAGAAAIAATVASAAGAQGVTTLYGNTPSPLPGNLPMVPFEPTGTSEFGDRVVFAGGAPRSLAAASVTLSSWACGSGHFYSGDCVTQPGAAFTLPVTLNLYAVGAGGSVGDLIAGVTQRFSIPYRPSADPAHCSRGAWFSGGRCFSGTAVTLTFDLKHLRLAIPGEIIFGVTFNTTHYGYEPVGEGAACFSSSGGCGYDWLGIGLADPATTLSAGSNPAPGDAYQVTVTDSCSNGAIAPFGLDAGCWTGSKPAVSFAGKPANQRGEKDED